MYEKFTPVIHRDGLTNSEVLTVQELDALMFSTGDIIYYDGVLKRLSIGTADQTLKVSGGLPAWVGVTKITVGTSEPTSPATGDLWVDTT